MSLEEVNLVMSVVVKPEQFKDFLELRLTATYNGKEYHVVQHCHPDNLYNTFDLVFSLLHDRMEKILKADWPPHTFTEYAVSGGWSLTPDPE